MPHDPGQEHISTEEQFRRLMATSEEDLPEVPEAPSILQPVGTPEGAAPEIPQAPTAGAVPAAEEEEPKADMARLVDLTEQVLATLMTLQDTLDVKLDLMGSSLELGYTDYRRTRGVRRGIVRNLRNDRNDNAQAIEDATRTAGPFHHSVENLPLASVRSVKFGPKKAMVRLGYQYSPFRPPFGNLPARSTIRTRSVESRTPVYRMEKGGPTPFLNGLPNGFLYDLADGELFDDQATPPTARPFARNAVQIFLQTNLDFNPMGQVLSKKGSVNDAGVLFAGFTFAAFTLKFEHLEVDWNIGHGSGRDPRTVRLTFQVSYVFTAVAGGHYNQILLKPGQKNPNTGKSVAQWETANIINAPAVSFVAAFPVHA